MLNKIIEEIKEFTLIDLPIMVFKLLLIVVGCALAILVWMSIILITVGYPWLMIAMVLGAAIIIGVCIYVYNTDHNILDKLKNLLK